MGQSSPHQCCPTQRELCGEKGSTSTQQVEEGPPAFPRFPCYWFTSTSLNHSFVAQSVIPRLHGLCQNDSCHPGVLCVTPGLKGTAWARGGGWHTPGPRGAAGTLRALCFPTAASSVALPSASTPWLP